MSEIHRIKCGNSNCYIVENGVAGILVDTGKRKFVNRVMEACRQYHVKLIVLTHAHFDHAENAAQISNTLGIPIGMSEKDCNLIQSNANISRLGNRTIYFGHGKLVPNKQWVKQRTVRSTH